MPQVYQRQSRWSQKELFLSKVAINKNTKIEYLIQVKIKNPFRNDREEALFIKSNLGLNDTRDDPACYSVVNDRSKESHHR